MIERHITLPYAEIAQFCQQNHIRKLSLFGSVLRDDFRPDSDIDVLVEFEPGHVPGLLKMAGLQIQLGDILSQEVDLRTAAELSRYFRQDVINNSMTIYDNG